MLADDSKGLEDRPAISSLSLPALAAKYLLLRKCGACNVTR